MNRSHHNPFHLRLDNAEYWLSASTLKYAPIFDTAQSLTILRDILRDVVRELEIGLRAWVIMPDHYHLLAGLPRGDQLEAFIRRLHGRSSYKINGLERKRGRRIWYQYWDRCVRSEGDFYTRFNYIHHNPVKHKYVVAPDEYGFSSYRYYLQKYGQEWLQSVWETYPIVDFTPEERDGRTTE